MTRNRSSASEWSGSRMVIDSQSPKTVIASSKLTRCFRSFAAAFRGSHSNFTPPCYSARSRAGSSAPIESTTAAPHPVICDAARKDCDAAKKHCDAAKKHCDAAKNGCDTTKKDCDATKNDCDAAKKDCDAAKKDCDVAKKDCGAAKKDCDAAKKDCDVAKKDCDATKKIAVPQMMFPAFPLRKSTLFDFLVSRRPGEHIRARRDQVPRIPRPIAAPLRRFWPVFYQNRVVSTLQRPRSLPRNRVAGILARASPPRRGRS
jgi:hypothetical protein